LVIHRSVAAVQGAQEAKFETKDELLEEDLISLERPSAVEIVNARSGKINVAELTVVTEYPSEVTTKPSPKSSFQSDDRIMDAVLEKPISSISGNPFLSLNLFMEVLEFLLVAVLVEVGLCTANASRTFFKI